MDIWNQISGNENEATQEKGNLRTENSKSRKKMNCLHAKTPQGSKTISRKKYPKFLMDEINIWSS